MIEIGVKAMARTKAGKAANGEGSIFQRKSDGRWVGRITLDDGSRKAFYAWKQSEVRDKLDTARAAKRTGRLRTTKGQALGTYLDGWLESKRHSVRVSTHENYRKGIEWLRPYLGRVRLDKLTAAHVQQAYTDMLNRKPSPLSPRSVQLSHAILRAALHRATRQGLIPFNPTDDVDAPSRGRYEPNVLTAEQAQRLFASSAEMVTDEDGSSKPVDPLHALWVTMTSTGLRIGEALGLKWDDVNLEDRTLAVRRAIQRQPKKGLVFVEPKTAKARRRVKLTVTATEALRRHRTRQLSHRLQLGGLWEDRNMVFASEFGTPLDPMNAYHRFQKALVRAGLDHIRLHDLRHTAATLMLIADVHPKVVQETLGHSNITLTLATYSHVLPSIQSESADKLDEAFNRAKSASS
jgi:integrase